ncbi:MAG: hypothetical protein JWQ44_586 [Chthoniobacter sp.]|nr:hypothetical protein [Chthoniobacter sp.]
MAFEPWFWPGFGGKALGEQELGVVQWGNLVTCKARVEVKLRNLKAVHSFTDREVGVAVDLGGYIAAKGALASAGAALAKRLAAKMR